MLKFSGCSCPSSGRRFRSRKACFLLAPSKVHKQQLRVDDRMADTTYPVDAHSGSLLKPLNFSQPNQQQG